MSKSIYTFTVDKVAKVSEKRTEKYTDESGSEKERTISEEVEKKIPIEVLIKKPNRKQVQEAEMLFSIEMSKCIKAGILTKAMLMNKYSDNGGLVNEQDNKILDNAYDQLESLQKELLVLAIKEESKRTDEEKEEIDAKQKQIVNLRKAIVQSEASYLDLFNHTADVKAQNKIVMWYVLSLSYYKDPSQNHEDYIPIFSGETFEEKEESLFKMEEENDELYSLVNNKLSSVISLWYFSGRIDSKEFDKVLEENAASQ